MKRFIPLVLILCMVLLTAGCAVQGNSLENVDTAEEVDVSKVKATDYKNNLEGLEQYLKALHYIPEKAEPTEMMYSVIGAVDGDRFQFTVNKRTVSMELYEYDPDKLDENGQRVMNEIKKDGKFYVFSNKDLYDNAAFEAFVSENQKYMLIYTDSSAEDSDNYKRKQSVIEAVKKFYP